MTGMQADCAVLPAAIVAAYVSGGLDPAADWSVEAHLPGCPACRCVLAACTDPAQLERNKAVVLARTGLPDRGLMGRVLRRCGVPEHVTVLLEGTPSLRGSWLAGVLAVLVIVVGASQLAALSGPVLLASTPGQLSWAVLIPFLVITPLLPLAAVAAAFSQMLDPAYRLTIAAPVSKVWLVCVRAVAVIAATMVPAALAAFALPGSHWLAAALLLPALAICAAALALATVIRAEAAAAAAGLAWVALVIGIAVTAGWPAVVVGLAGQLTAVAVLTTAVALIALRRNTIDYGWTG